MILAMVTFVPQPRAEIGPRQRRELLERTAPRYRSIPGLIRKYFIGQADGQPGGRAGGAYEWQSRAAAEAYYTEDWRRFMTETYGSDLRIEYFDCPCVVDNAAGRIEFAPEPAP